MRVRKIGARQQLVDFMAALLGIKDFVRKVVDEQKGFSAVVTMLHSTERSSFWQRKLENMSGRTFRIHVAFTWTTTQREIETWTCSLFFSLILQLSLRLSVHDGEL